MSWSYDQLAQRADLITRTMDQGNTFAAADLMRDELMRLRTSPRAQETLVDLVDRWDRKGVGADLDMSLFRRGCSVFESVSITGWQREAPRWGYAPSQWRMQRLNVGSVYLGEDWRCQENRYWR